MRPYTRAYSTSSTVVTLASILGVTQCKWFAVQPLGSSAGRVGDSHVAEEARGIPFDNSAGVNASTAGFFAPPIALAMDFYDLTKWFLVVEEGTAYVSCGV